MSHPRNPQICPTYVVTDKSMKDVFFCYVMHEPIPMYYGLHKKIQRLYDALSRAIHHMWDSYYYDDVTRQVVYKYECFKPQPANIFKTCILHSNPDSPRTKLRSTMSEHWSFTQKLLARLQRGD